MALNRVRNFPGVGHLLLLRSNLANWWFDVSRHVQTRGYTSLEGLHTVGAASGFAYLPTFAHVAGRLLRRLPQLDLSTYTFIDLGSGKGRMLFVAAEYPFARIQGVEFATELHDCAVQNIKSYRHRRQRCRTIESLNLNAADYEFPAGNLVVYLFNPFGPDVMQAVLHRLDASLARTPRDAFLIMLHPDATSLADALSNLRLYHEGFRCQIYRSTKA